MQIIGILLGAAEKAVDPETIEKTLFSDWFNLKTITILVAANIVICGVMLLRQKKIAENQVQLAEFMSEMAKKK